MNPTDPQSQWLCEGSYSACIFYLSVVFNHSLWRLTTAPGQAFVAYKMWSVLEFQLRTFPNPMHVTKEIKRTHSYLVSIVSQEAQLWRLWWFSLCFTGASQLLIDVVKIATFYLNLQCALMWISKHLRFSGHVNVPVTLTEHAVRDNTLRGTVSCSVNSALTKILWTPENPFFAISTQKSNNKIVDNLQYSDFNLYKQVLIVRVKIPYFCAQ